MGSIQLEPIPVTIYGSVKVDSPQIELIWQ